MHPENVDNSLKTSENEQPQAERREAHRTGDSASGSSPAAAFTSERSELLTRAVAHYTRQQKTGGPGGHPMAKPPN